MLIASSLRRLAFLLILTLSLPLAARADEASHRAKAKEMMTIMHTQKMVQQVTENIKAQIAQAAEKVAGPAANDDAKAKAAQFEKKANELIDAKLGWDAMQASFTDVYVKNFTEEQLDSIIAFYKTPAGTALLETLPTVNSQVGQIGNSHMAELQPQLKQLFEEFQKSESGSEKTPVPAPAPVSPSSNQAPAAAPGSAPRPVNTPK
jgi:hypothetical protein